MSLPPPDHLQHILACLSALDLRIRREVLRARLSRPLRGDDEFHGLYISDDECDDLLASSPGGAALLPPDQDDRRLAALADELARCAAQICDLEARCAARQAHLPLLSLCRSFGLSAFERETILICLAAEVDLKYERLYAYLQDDVTKKRPTVDLVLRLLCPTLAERIAARPSFLSSAPLLRWDLLSLHDDPGARRPVLPARYLKLDERIAGYLLGSGAAELRLAPLAADGGPADELPPRPEVWARLEQWGAAWGRSWARAGPVLAIHGSYGAGRRAAAAYLGATLGRPLLVLSAAELAGGALGPAEAVLLAEREALLTGALLCWAEADALLFPQPGAEAQQRAFLRALARGSTPAVLLTERPWEPGRGLRGRPFLRLEIPAAGYAERRAHWGATLDGAAPALGEAELSALAARFRLSPGQIRDALALARSTAWMRDPHQARLTGADLDAACRAQAQHHLGSLARKIVPLYGWGDIVLPPPQLAVLRLICTTIRHRPVVYGDWGFERKLARGKGTIVLFAGQSGTGKTMAAEIIAGDLGLDLYAIDLATVVSKYIGETEKNLERIFNEAQESDAILFFDEADAIFGKRSEVKDAHDRYANIETAYLLQRTESYSGLVILASNLKKNIDEAFVRRLHFTVDFPLPEEAERLEIWRRTFPPELPRAADIDLPFLARRLKLTGGNIRNIILAAAFLAAEDGQPVAMAHLMRAAGYELQKMGKLVAEAEFTDYAETVKGA